MPMIMLKSALLFALFLGVFGPSKCPTLLKNAQIPLNYPEIPGTELC